MPFENQPNVYRGPRLYRIFWYWFQEVVGPILFNAILWPISSQPASEPKRIEGFHYEKKQAIERYSRFYYFGSLLSGIGYLLFVLAPFALYFAPTAGLTGLLLYILLGYLAYENYKSIHKLFE